VIKEVFMLIQKQGVIKNFNREKQYGWISVVEAGLVEQFFFYQDRIIKGPIVPGRGARVDFKISPAPVQPGRLRVAIDLEIEIPADVQGGQSDWPD
jgi:hypothetical protein